MTAIGIKAAHFINSLRKTYKCDHYNMDMVDQIVTKATRWYNCSRQNLCDKEWLQLVCANMARMHTKSHIRYRLIHALFEIVTCDSSSNISSFDTTRLLTLKAYLCHGIVSKKNTSPGEDSTCRSMNSIEKRKKIKKKKLKKKATCTPVIRETMEQIEVDITTIHKRLHTCAASCFAQKVKSNTATGYTSALQRILDGKHTIHIASQEPSTFIDDLMKQMTPLVHWKTLVGRGKDSGNGRAAMGALYEHIEKCGVENFKTDIYRTSIES